MGTLSSDALAFLRNPNRPPKPSRPLMHLPLEHKGKGWGFCFHAVTILNKDWAQHEIVDGLAYGLLTPGNGTIFISGNNEAVVATFEHQPWHCSY